MDDAETMNEIGNYDRPRGRFYWETGKNATGFLRHNGAAMRECVWEE